MTHSVFEPSAERVEYKNDFDDEQHGESKDVQSFIASNEAQKMSNEYKGIKDVSGEMENDEFSMKGPTGKSGGIGFPGIQTHVKVNPYKPYKKSNGETGVTGTLGPVCNCGNWVQSDINQHNDEVLYGSNPKSMLRVSTLPFDLNYNYKTSTIEGIPKIAPIKSFSAPKAEPNVRCYTDEEMDMIECSSQSRDRINDKIDEDIAVYKLVDHDDYLRVLEKTCDFMRELTDFQNNIDHVSTNDNPKIMATLLEDCRNPIRALYMMLHTFVYKKSDTLTTEQLEDVEYILDTYCDIVKTLSEKHDDFYK